MKKSKKRSNSFSKLQKGILFVLVLVAASLIGFTVAVINDKNPFQFLSWKKFGVKGRNSKLKLSVTMDEYIDGNDLTESHDLHKSVLIAKNSNDIPNPTKPEESYISQFLHELFVKDKYENGKIIDVNSSFHEDIKKQANVEVGVKFFLVPKELQDKDPKKFDEADRAKLLDFSEFTYEVANDQGTFSGKPEDQKKYFGSYVVFDNEVKNGSSFKYQYNWLEEDKVSEDKVKVNALYSNSSRQYYLPKDNVFTSEKLKNSTSLQNELSENANNFYSAYSSSSVEMVAPQQKIIGKHKIPTPDNIFENISSDTKKFYIYKPYDKNNSNVCYPKLIRPKGTNSNDYIKTKALILINFWNEMALDESFFGSEQAGVNKDDFMDNDHDLTLFVQVNYNLVDDTGELHSFTTETKGPKLPNMNLDRPTKASEGKSAPKRSINVKRDRSIKNTITRP
ncbi:hypothetical protein CWO85_02715 [Candidatus Phytoplasma ziziphi]|uniref:Uncharacterized protein n=1 Tax=Ziziphus jujuba witches'-broom phytoplasma TaxID=135727 RepID=A0A660HMY5_ZIZJU|nr:hypothetical protein [Candidatus Phytoplasma ziziphi]AYJ01401.1 hypothetical protein CWO85_02715 [Candidatus Phytoplasma ziziphi]